MEKPLNSVGRLFSRLAVILTVLDATMSDVALLA